MKVLCKNSDDTEKLGNVLGELAQDGDVFCLNGDLGAGKTLLANGVATALGILPAEITSPTFAIMNIYHADMEVRHFDLYRLNNSEELFDIGFHEYAGNSGVTMIEWSDLFKDELPLHYLYIKINVCLEGRLIELLPIGERYEKMCEEVKKYVDIID